jgi:hypothetical protein
MGPFGRVDAMRKPFGLRISDVPPSGGKSG